MKKDSQNCSFKLETFHSWTIKGAESKTKRVLWRRRQWDILQLHRAALLPRGIPQAVLAWSCSVGKWLLRFQSLLSGGSSTSGRRRWHTSSARRPRVLGNTSVVFWSVWEMSGIGLWRFPLQPAFEPDVNVSPSIYFSKNISLFSNPSRYRHCF